MSAPAKAESAAPAAPAKARPRRVRTPTVLQMEAVECGAAALAMVLAHFGRVVPLDELRLACGVSRDGSKANNVVRAARTYGLGAKGFRKEPAGLRDVPLPAILHWNFNHFVVLDGFGKGCAYINDPASGPVTVSETELDHAFTGVVLVFERGPDFRRGGKSPSLMAALRRRLTGMSLAVSFVVLAGIALLVPGLVAPTFNKIFVDDVLVRGLMSWVRPLMLAIGATALVTFALTALQQHYLLRLESRLSLQSSGRFFWHVLRLPVQFFTQRYAGDIANRVGINDKVAKLLSGDLASTAVSLLVVALYALLLFQYDALLAAVGVATASLNLAALKYASRTRTNVSQRLVQDRGKMMGCAMGALQTIETLKATGSESDFFSRWAGHQAKVVKADQELDLTTLLLSSVPPLLLAINTCLVLGLGGLRVMDGHLTVGMLTAFQALLLAFLNPINRMVDLGGNLQEMKGDMNRLDDVLEAKADRTVGALPPPPPRASEPEAPRPAPAKLSGRLELKGVTFGYSALEPPLIEDFYLTLKPGSRVALVGGSGSGKSTVARLVAGLYEPWQGQILFDGRPREQIPRDVLVHSLAVVDQDICLFEDTVKANLALWDHTVSEADLVQAATDASIHDEVSARPGGYASLIEEGGRNFSGGQQQRMEIARALLLNPSILVLDEATSALDPTTEKLIDDSLRRRGCTCLIVAHRLSTIRDCDEIIVLERGRVVQRGSHDELYAAVGPYRNLLAAEAT